MSRRVVRLRDNRFAAGPVMSPRTVRPPPTAAVAPVPPADHLTAGMRAVVAVAVAGWRQKDRPIRKARRPAVSREIGPLISPVKGGHLISPEKGGPPAKRELADRLTIWAARTATHPIVGCG
jgi:hypothetical protein